MKPIALCTQVEAIAPNNGGQFRVVADASGDIYQQIIAPVSLPALSEIGVGTALGLSAPALAQEHMIDGNAVPADQVEAVQASCDELRAAAPAAGGETSAPAAGAETPAPAADAATPAPDAGAAAPAAGAQIDLETLTIEMCDEGGFTASAN